MSPRRRLGAVRWSLLALCVMVLLGFGFRRPLLVAAGDFLNVGQAPVEADLVLLLGGDIHSRPLAAAELYLRGFAPVIVMSRVSETPATKLGVFPNETDATRELLLRVGVPDSAVIVLDGAHGVASTTDEAVQIRHYLDAHDADRILVLTSDYHTRRARWNLRRQLEGLELEMRMVSAPDPRFSSRDWWRSEEGMIAYTQEYVKFVHNYFYR